MDGKKILITGGTGTLGHALVNRILNDYKETIIIIVSRDEYKQYIMKNKYNSNRLKFIICDVRDRKGVEKVIKGVDYVIHAAALKQVPVCEYYPEEAVKTNIGGSINVINACLQNDIPVAIAIGTDKAVFPINTYGLTKAIMEKYFMQVNICNQTIFTMVRYGNVMGSRGSLIPVFENMLKSTDRLPLTHKDATRFWLFIDEAVDIILYGLKNGKGGEIFIPLMPSFKICELIKLMEAKWYLVGLRPGEKIHENITNDYEDVYFLLPYYVLHSIFSKAKKKGTKVEKALCSSDFVVDVNKLKELYSIYKGG